MSDTQNRIIELQQHRVYAFLEKHHKWAVSACEDAGLLRAIAVANPEVQYKPIPGKANTFQMIWIVDNDSFLALQPLLDALDYEDLSLASKSVPQEAAFKVTQTKSDQVSYSSQQNVHTYSIAELSKEIKGALALAFPQKIWLKGEISGIKNPNPHVYFDLVESGVKNKNTEKIKAVIWADVWSVFDQKIRNQKLPELANGVEIRVLGTINYYSGCSQISFYIQDIDEKFAEGEFYRRKAEIEEKLRTMGIHDKNSALPMPSLPLNLAVFSNQTAAGWRDFVTELQKSGFPFKITLFSVGLQGNHLEPSFLKAFEQLEAVGYEHFDLAVIVRGGGGASELGGFNCLTIAEFIARSPLKFAVGIGHEEDRTVLDEICLRQKTPTAVAQMLVSLLQNQEMFLLNAISSLESNSRRILDTYRMTLHQHTSKCLSALKDKNFEIQSGLQKNISNLKAAVLNRVYGERMAHQRACTEIGQAAHHQIQEAAVRLREQKNSIEKATHSICMLEENYLDSLRTKLMNTVDIQMHSQRSKVDQMATQLYERTCGAKENAFKQIDFLKQKLELIDPQNVFRRGFVVLADSTGRVLSNKEDVAPNDKLTIRMLDAHIDVTVDNIRD